MKNVLEDQGLKDLAFGNAKRKAHDYYTSCMDLNGTIEALGGKPLLSMLRERLVGWHLLQREEEEEKEGPDQSDLEQNNEDWAQSFVANFTAKVAKVHHELQSDGFFTWVVGGDDRNSSTHVIQVDQGGLSLPNREHYLNENDTKIVTALKTLMYRLIKLLIADDTQDMEPVMLDQGWNDRIRDEIDRIVEFETKLANITIPDVQKRGEEMGLPNRKTLHDLNVAYDFLNWTSYFQNAFGMINHTITNETEVLNK